MAKLLYKRSNESLTLKKRISLNYELAKVSYQCFVNWFWQGWLPLSGLKNFNHFSKIINYLLVEQSNNLLGGKIKLYSLFHFFGLFTQTILTPNQCEKCHVHLVYGAEIRTHNLSNMSHPP